MIGHLRDSAALCSSATERKARLKLLSAMRQHRGFVEGRNSPSLEDWEQEGLGRKQKS